MAKLTVQTDETLFRVDCGDIEGSLADYEGVSAVKDSDGNIYYGHFPNGPDSDPETVEVLTGQSVSYEVEEAEFDDEEETEVETPDAEEEEEEEEEEEAEVS